MPKRTARGERHIGITVAIPLELLALVDEEAVATGECTSEVVTRRLAATFAASVPGVERANNFVGDCP